MARWLQKQTHDEYISGLWRKDIEYQLLWSVKDDSLTYRPHIYRAPSWSWASVDGVISWEHWKSQAHFDLVIGIEEIIDIKGDMDSSSEPRKAIRLQCRGIIYYRSFRRIIAAQFCSYSSNWDTTPKGVIMDTYVLPIIIRGPSNDRHLAAGLLLQSTPKKGQYQRVGMFRVYGNSTRPLWSDVMSLSLSPPIKDHNIYEQIIGSPGQEKHIISII